MKNVTLNAVHNLAYNGNYAVWISTREEAGLLQFLLKHHADR